MRARNIKPGFFKSEGLASCSFQARLLFIGLWCVADREGRLEDRPARIKAELFPYDNVNIEKLLDELASKKDCDGTPSFIVRYGHPKRYIQILHFLSHQHPHMNEQESIIPDISTCTVQAPDDSGKTPSESLLPITDSLIPITDTSPPVRNYFSIFYKTYPKKKARPLAEKAFAKLKMDDTLMDKVMGGLFRAMESEEWTKENGKFVPFPATWINQRRWEDES